MLALYPLGERGLDHLEEKLQELSSAGRRPAIPVANVLNQKAIYNSGNVYALAQTPLPCNLDMFDSACGRGGEEVPSLLASWASDFLRRDSNHFCLIVEHSMEPTDPIWLNEVSSEMSDFSLLCDGAIVYYFSQQNYQQSDILKIISETYWFGFCLVLIACDTDCAAKLLTKNSITQDDLLQVIVNVKGIAVDAYDLEGAVVWTSTTQTTELRNPW